MDEVSHSAVTRVKRKYHQNLTTFLPLSSVLYPKQQKLYYKSSFLSMLLEVNLATAVKKAESN